MLNWEFHVDHLSIDLMVRQRRKDVLADALDLLILSSGLLDCGILHDSLPDALLPLSAITDVFIIITHA